MTTALWIVQIILGLLFIVTGSFKFFQSKEKVIASGGTWAEDFAPGFIKLVAAAELICGLLLIIERRLWHGHYLNVIAAACIAIIMLGAIVTHISRKEYKHAGINCVFLLMAGFVIYEGLPH